MYNRFSACAYTMKEEGAIIMAYKHVRASSVSICRATDSLQRETKNMAAIISRRGAHTENFCTHIMRD